MTTTTAPANGAMQKAAPHTVAQQQPPRNPIALSTLGVVLESLDDVQRFAMITVASGFYPAAMKNDPIDMQVAQATMKILYGRELGLSPMQAMQGIYVVDGKISLAAHVIASLIERTPKLTYKVLQFDNAGTRLEWRVNNERVGESAFTVEDAQRAGLTSKHNWKSYPKAMCWARALTQGARAFATSVFNGAVYAPEELGAENDDVLEFDGAGKPIAGSRAQVSSPVQRGKQQQQRRNETVTDAEVQTKAPENKAAASSNKKPANEQRADAAEAQGTPESGANQESPAADNNAPAETTVAAEQPTAASPETTVVRDEQAQASPPDDVPEVKAPDEVLPPVENAEYSQTLQLALAKAPRDGKIDSITAFMPKALESLSREEGELLRVWVRAVRNVALKKPELDGLNARQGEIVERLKKVCSLTNR